MNLPAVAQLLRELGAEIRSASEDELEELTDLLIDELLRRIPLPRWLPFVRPWLRRKLDALLPHGLFDAIEWAVACLITNRSLRGRLKG